jgi:hypothetical protein
MACGQNTHQSTDPDYNAAAGPNRRERSAQIDARDLDELLLAVADRLDPPVHP